MKPVSKIIFLLAGLAFLIFACTSSDRDCDEFRVNITQVGSNILKAEVLAGSGKAPYHYEWSNGVSGLSEITVTSSGTYSVTATEYGGCQVTNYFDFILSTCDSTVTDVDGNIYEVVSIGNKCWMKTNLRVSAGISEISDSSDWNDIFDNNLTTPAWCYYQNNPANANQYGKLYNWYAVSSGNLCPTGWHIPTHAEWQTLIDAYGGNATAGGALKDTTGWDTPNTGATNISGFSALPGGSRNLNGNYVSLGTYGVFWSSTENSVDQAWARELAYNNSTISIANSSKARGYSCRCVKN